VADEILELVDLHKAYGALPVLNGVSLTVRRGEMVVVVGPSGNGKSTLLKCINLIEVPDRGEVRFLGRDYVPFARARGIPVRGSAELRYLRTHIGIVFQQFNLFPHLTVIENVMLAPMRVRGLPRREARERAAAALDRIGLSDKADAHPATLSGGQQQRAAIARALVMEPQLMLFDEVTSALDPELVGEVVEEIKRLAGSGMTMIVVTHQMGLARECGDRMIFMDGGTIVEEGPPAQLIASAREARTRDFMRCILF
jgi:ABC-type polar amino acid transport system ATPase subunit